LSVIQEKGERLNSLKDRLEAVLQRIGHAAQLAGRNPQSVHLVAVTKTVPADVVKQAIHAGVTRLGENYIQEATEKFQALYREAVGWHFIGHLQSNKAKFAVRMFDLIHSVDSFKLAREIDRQAAKLDKIQKILIQVNISGESTKSGIEEQQAMALVRQIAPLPHTRVCGLMTMPPFFNAPETVRPFFRRLRLLSERMAAETIPTVSMQELSMGMTGDFEVAIAEGATLVRIGTAIFGERQ
jgi:pyridoxal phosphate enzyme (YggS family)